MNYNTYSCYIYRSSLKEKIVAASNEVCQLKAKIKTLSDQIHILSSALKIQRQLGYYSKDLEDGRTILFIEMSNAENKVILLQQDIQKYECMIEEI